MENENEELTDEIAITDQEAKEYIASAIENLKIEDEFNLRVMPFGNKVVIVFDLEGKVGLTSSGLDMITKFQGEVEGATIGLNVYRKKPKANKPANKKLIVG